MEFSFIFQGEKTIIGVLAGETGEETGGEMKVEKRGGSGVGEGW